MRIGQDITITFLGIRGQVTRIGIDAPSSVRILRGELDGGCGSVEPADEGALCAPIDR